VDFRLGLNLRESIKKISLVLSATRDLEIETEAVMIEHDGNIVLTFLLCCHFFRKDIFLDCHNCSVEYQRGGMLIYAANFLLLFFCGPILGARLVLHNDLIRRKFPLKAAVMYTPYPDLSAYIGKEKVNDVIFSCSLNRDEPVARIIDACLKLGQQGYSCRISGNTEKLDASLRSKGEKYFTNYLSKHGYLSLLASSRLMVSLTDRKDTVLFSPREGISLGLKVLANNSQANLDFYGDKIITVSTEDDLAEVIRDALR